MNYLFMLKLHVESEGDIVKYNNKVCVLDVVEESEYLTNDLV